MPATASSRAQVHAIQHNKFVWWWLATHTVSITFSKNTFQVAFEVHIVVSGVDGGLFPARYFRWQMKAMVLVSAQRAIKEALVQF